jgi:hypothetical protein
VASEIYGQADERACCDAGGVPINRRRVIGHGDKRAGHSRGAGADRSLRFRKLNRNQGRNDGK